MTEQLVELMARALADACPTPDQCADTHAECVRQHGVHWLAVGPGGIGPQHITSIEGSPTAIARVVLSALTAAGYQVLPPGGRTRTEWATRLKAHGEYDEELRPSFSGAGMTEEERARTKAAHWRRRFGDELVDVMRRAIHIGPWQPDTEEAPDA